MAELDLAEVTELAELQFSPHETALILGVDVAAIECDPGATAYMRGRLRAQAEVRKSILQMARQGSTPAQKHFMQIVADSATPAVELDNETE